MSDITFEEIRVATNDLLQTLGNARRQWAHSRWARPGAEQSGHLEYLATYTAARIFSKLFPAHRVLMSPEDEAALNAMVDNLEEPAVPARVSPEDARALRALMDNPEAHDV